MHSLERSSDQTSLRNNNNKLMNVIESGPEGGDHITYVHGLGAAHEYWQPLISSLNLDATHRKITFDLEGHGLSPVATTSIASISSFAADLAALVAEPGILVAHSMACLVALSFSIAHAELVTKLILLGATRNPLAPGIPELCLEQAAVIRAKGLQGSGVAERSANTGTSKKTKETRSAAVGAIRDLLLSQDLEGFARGYTALAGATEVLDLSTLKMPVLLIQARRLFLHVRDCEGLQQEVEAL